MMSEMLAAWPSHSLLMRWCAVAKTDVRRRVAADDAADCGCSADGDGCTTWFRPNASRLLLALLQSCGRSALARHEREVMRTMQIAEGSEDDSWPAVLSASLAKYPVAPTRLDVRVEVVGLSLARRSGSRPCKSHGGGRKMRRTKSVHTRKAVVEWDDRILCRGRRIAAVR